MEAEGWRTKGRGSNNNPKNRFERFEVEWEAGDGDEPRVSPRTRFYDDASETIISYNTSPDIPFKASVNPYRGCEHGCSYCYARPSHEYLGFSAGLDFETKIMVKRRAPELLRGELASPRWKPQWIAMSGVTDCYQPVERSLQLTRQCLQALAEFRNPVGIVTKNRLVTRDVDVLGEMAKRSLCQVAFSINSLDSALARKMEPRTSAPQARLEAIARLSAAGVPAGILIAPVVPGLNDHEIPSILKAAAEAGATFASYVLLRLPHGVKDLFFDWVASAYPGKSQRIESRLRDIRDGALNRSEFGERFSGTGVFAQQIRQLFEVSRRRYGISGSAPPLSTQHFRRPASPQMEFEL